MTEAEDLLRVLNELERARSTLQQIGSPTGHAEVHVNLGGFGVWVSTTACLIMLVCGGYVAFDMSRDMSRELDKVDKQMIEVREENKTMQSYLAAIYMQAPHLKPKEEEKD